MAYMPSSWSKAGGEQEEQRDGGEGWGQALLLWTPAPVNLRNPHVSRDSTPQNEAVELGTEGVSSPYSKFSTLTSNQKWETELEVEVNLTFLNFKVWQKRKVETATWRSEDLPWKIRRGVSDLVGAVYKEAEEMALELSADCLHRLYTTVPSFSFHIVYTVIWGLHSHMETI